MVVQEVSPGSTVVLSLSVFLGLDDVAKHLLLKRRRVVDGGRLKRRFELGVDTRHVRHVVRLPKLQVLNKGKRRTAVLRHTNAAAPRETTSSSLSLKDVGERQKAERLHPGLHRQVAQAKHDPRHGDSLSQQHPLRVGAGGTGGEGDGV